nr:MAG TPA: hypothetical protein [Caudoviricetes sp.]
MKKYFKIGEQVKLINELGEDFDVKIINLVCDYGGDGKMYYVVEPVGFYGFNREVLCERCYKEKQECE